MADETRTKSRREFLQTGAMAVGAVMVVAGTSIASTTTNKRHRWGFLIDLDRCTGCKACAVACKTEFEVPLGVFRSSVKQLDEGPYPKTRRSFLPWLCNHCENPICLENCPVEEIEATFVWPDNTVEKYRKRATYQRPDGVVLVDQDRCVACGACIGDCPYGVRFFNPAKKATSPDAIDEHPADKCDLCVHRLDAGMVPACVNTCPAGARMVGDLNDPASAIAQIIQSKPVQVLLPEKGTRPQCRYVSLNPATYTKGKNTREG